MSSCNTMLFVFLVTAAAAACSDDEPHTGEPCTDCAPDDADVDADNDGFTQAQGDCDDQNRKINPAALEDFGPSTSGNGIDDDCDGATDEVDPCDCEAPLGPTAAAADCSSEIACDPRFVRTAGVVSSPTGHAIEGSFEAIPQLGSPDNDLAPRRGSSYLFLTTGLVHGSLRNTSLIGGSPQPDPFGSPLDFMFDAVEYTVELEAPKNALGFEIQYLFFSVEYDDYVGSEKNDKFYIILNGPTSTGGEDLVINHTECRDPANYHDTTIGEDCETPSGYCCYIAINSALSDCCWFPENSVHVPGSESLPPCPNAAPVTDIDGTGFECASREELDSGSKGSSTGWLSTRADVAPGELLTLTFHIHDTDDAIYDSAVLIDNFRWLTGEFEGGTAPL